MKRGYEEGMRGMKRGYEGREGMRGMKRGMKRG
jgi:hypothetical protein